MAKWLNNDCKIIIPVAGERKLLCHYGCFFHPKFFAVSDPNLAGKISLIQQILKPALSGEFPVYGNIDYFNIRKDC
jgi:hypothetical protein